MVSSSVSLDKALCSPLVLVPAGTADPLRLRCPSCGTRFLNIPPEKLLLGTTVLVPGAGAQQHTQHAQHAGQAQLGGQPLQPGAEAGLVQAQQLGQDQVAHAGEKQQQQEQQAGTQEQVQGAGAASETSQQQAQEQQQQQAQQDEEGGLVLGEGSAAWPENGVVRERDVLEVSIVGVSCVNAMNSYFPISYFLCWCVSD